MQREPEKTEWPRATEGGKATAELLPHSLSLELEFVGAAWIEFLSAELTHSARLFFIFSAFARAVFFHPLFALKARGKEPRMLIGEKLIAVMEIYAKVSGGIFSKRQAI